MLHFRAHQESSRDQNRGEAHAKQHRVRRQALPNGRAHDPRVKPQQIDLFGDEPQAPRSAAPAWPDCRGRRRAALTDLMARLLLDHADKEAGPAR